MSARSPFGSIKALDHLKGDLRPRGCNHLGDPVAVPNHMRAPSADGIHRHKYLAPVVAVDCSKRDGNASA